MSDIATQVAVVGAGPAGLAAAVTAAEQGSDVLLIDAAPRAGGQIWRHRANAHAPRAAHQWLQRAQHPRITHMPASQVVDGAGTSLTVDSAHGAHSVTADTVVVATGAREQFLPFPGWTLPGVVGVGGAQALLKAGWEVRGRRVVLAGSGPLMMPVAAALSRAGARVVEVAEQAPLHRVAGFGASRWRRPSDLAAALRYRAGFIGARYRTGTWVRAAIDSAGALSGVVLTDGRRERTIECDILCTGYGLVPSTELARLLGCTILHGAVHVDGQQRTSVAGVLCAGEPTGIAGVTSAVLQGRAAGFAAASRAVPTELTARVRRERAHGAALRDAFVLRDELRALAKPDTIVCRCEDVRRGEVEACTGAREAKLLTRMGMGACQGRVCGPAARLLFDWTEDSVRAPIFPARVSTLMQETRDAEG